MDLVERYLQAVKFWLPREMQEDIVAELSEDLYSQEAELGRQLTQPEWEAILKRRGSPIMVATHYLPQRYLIGPMLFPIYCFVLKIIAFCYLLPCIAVWVGIAILVPSYRATHPGFSLFEALWGYVWWTAVSSTFIVTAIFVLVERSKVHAKLLGSWNPGKLPPVRDKSRISRGTSVFEMVVNLIGAWWFAAAVAASPVLFEVGAVKIALTPLGRTLAMDLIALSLLAAGLAATNLLRPYWTRMRRGIRITYHLLSAALLGFMFHAGPLVDVSGPGTVMHVVTMTMSSILLAAVMISILLAILEARHLVGRADSERFLVVAR